MDIGLFTPGVIYSVPMILIGVWLIWRARREPAVAASR
jgi:phosphatidylglycerol:prolipoprotein diacylglycerol transferase